MQAARVALQSASKLATQGGAVTHIPAPAFYEHSSKPIPSPAVDFVVATVLGVGVALSYKVSFYILQAHSGVFALSLNRGRLPDVPAFQ